MVHESLHLATAPQRFPRQVGSDLAHASLECADLQGVIASGGEALQLPDDVATAPFGIGNQPGQDLLPLPFKGVFPGTPPAQDAFSLFLLSVQGMELGCRTGNAPLDGNVSCCTTFNGKDANGSRRWV